MPKNYRHQTPGGPKRGHRHPNAQTRTQLTQLGPPHSHGEAEQRHETKVDTEAGMLSGVSRKRSIRSNPCWFTEFCKSQCLSHFAAPFIVVRAETSIAESCEKLSSNLVADTKRNSRRHKELGRRHWQREPGAGLKPSPRLAAPEILQGAIKSPSTIPQVDGQAKYRDACE